MGIAVADILRSQPSEFEGLLYMMLRVDAGGVVPLYIGRAGRHGKNNVLVSANLEAIGRTRCDAAAKG